MSSYRAVVCNTLGTPETLRLLQVKRRPCPHGGVRVAIKAAGLNFPDVLMIQGQYQFKPELPFTPGLEAAGEVIEAGPGATQHALGARVIVRMRMGGYAEEAVVDARDAIPLPPAFSFAEGATYLVGHVTAYHGLVTRGGLVAGETLLVLGAAGGVGLAAVEIGSVLGARVIAVASTAAKRDIARGKGAAEVVDATTEPLSKVVGRLTAGHGADVVLDPVGLAQEEALRCVAPGGRLLIAGFAGGSIPAYAANRILLKGASVIGVRAGEAARQNPGMRVREQAVLMDYAAQGKLRPHVSATLPLSDYARAMRLLLDRQAVGRIALAMP